MPAKPKAYHAHDMLYRNMAKKGASSWDQSAGYKQDMDPDFKRFLEDAVSQEWFPRTGSMIELGCGTAPALRWFNDLGWKGAGVDISPKAIRMAKAQSKGRGLKFQAGDVTKLDAFADESFDFVLDGHCLHCIVEKKDRQAFFRVARRILKPGGLILIDTMSAPVQRKMYREKHGILESNVAWNPVKDAQNFAGARKIDGKWHIPTRYFEHWKNILKSVCDNGFFVRLFRVNTDHPNEAVSNLSVVARKIET